MRHGLALGVALSGAVGLIGYRRGSLAPSGAAGAVAVGTPIYAAGGLRWSTLLLAFFVSSSALSHFGRRRKAEVAAEFSKGERRDLGQALANGGVAAALATLSLLRPRWSLGVAIAGAFAEANADTWATEVGTLSTAAPRLITTGRAVPAGTSGGVTPLGLAAATGGALTVALPAALLLREGERAGASRSRLLVAVTLAGLAGSLCDSLLGATLQAMYWCPHCSKTTERRIHRCGTPTSPHHGLPWMDNDLVNGLCTLIAALAALVMAMSDSSTPTAVPV